MKQNHNNQYIQVRNEMWQTLFFFAICMLAVAYYSGYLAARKSVFTCGAENKVQVGTQEQFMESNYFFPGGNLQSDQMAHKGQYSVKIGGDVHAFAFDTKVELQGGELVKVQLWKNGNGADAKHGKVAFSVKGEQFWKTAEQVVEKTNDGWEYIYDEFHIPQKLAGKRLDIFCWNDGPDPIWIDDFVLEIIRQ